MQTEPEYTGETLADHDSAVSRRDCPLAREWGFSDRCDGSARRAAENIFTARHAFGALAGDCMFDILFRHQRKLNGSGALHRNALRTALRFGTLSVRH